MKYIIDMNASGYINIRQDEDYRVLQDPRRNQDIVVDERAKTIYIQRPLEDHELVDNLISLDYEHLMLPGTGCWYLPKGWKASGVFKDSRNIFSCWRPDEP